MLGEGGFCVLKPGLKLSIKVMVGRVLGRRVFLLKKDEFYQNKLNSSPIRAERFHRLIRNTVTAK